MSSREERGAELLERLLHAADARPDELASEPGERDELRALAAFVERCRATRGALERDVASAHLVRRVLERTTRDDPSWFGDVRLVRRFVGRRLRTSALLRFVAASLVVHLVALPVVAWIVLDEPDEPALRLSIEHEPVDPYAPEEPEPAELDYDFGDVQADADRLEGRTRATYAERWDVENALAADRYVLTQRRFESTDAAPSEPALRLLLERQRVADEGPAEAGAPPVPSDPLARVLWVELELDRVALGRPRRRPELVDVLADLAALVDGTDEPVARLARAARQRARAYGVLPVEPGFHWRAWTLAARGGRGLGAALSEIVERRGGRLEAREWRSALSSALEARGLDDGPIGRSWR